MNLGASVQEMAALGKDHLMWIKMKMRCAGISRIQLYLAKLGGRP